MLEIGAVSNNVVSGLYLEKSAYKLSQLAPAFKTSGSKLILSDLGGAALTLVIMGFIAGID